MTMSATIDTWTGRLGLLLGFCTVAAWLAIAGKPAAAPAPSASIRLGTLATGELDISPLRRPVIDSSGLRPGADAEAGTVRIRNQTPGDLDVALRTTASQKELDRLARIEVAAGRRTIVRGPLRSTRSWSHTTIHLAPGETRRLHARVWIPSAAPDGWQAARGDVTLELRDAGAAGR
jgi:hypothetical protein